MQDFMNLLAKCGIKDRLSKILDRNDYAAFASTVLLDILSTGELREEFIRVSYGCTMIEMAEFILREKAEKPEAQSKDEPETEKPILRSYPVSGSPEG